MDDKITISAEEYKHLVACSVILEIIKRHAINSEYVNDRVIREVLDIKKEGE